MTNFDINKAVTNVVFHPDSKVVNKRENENGRFTTIKADDRQSVVFIDKDFDFVSDEVRFTRFDNDGRRSAICDDDNMDGVVDLFARFEYNENESCIGSWDLDNDGDIDEYTMPNCDSENERGRYTTLSYSNDGLHSEIMYIDRDFDLYADESRETIYNEDGTRNRVYDDFNLDGKSDRIGYFKTDETGKEIFAAWDNNADGEIDFYEQY